MSFKTRLLILLISTPLVLFVGVGGLAGRLGASGGRSAGVCGPAVVRADRPAHHEQLRRARGRGQGDGRRDARPGRRPRPVERVSAAREKRRDRQRARRCRPATSASSSRGSSICASSASRDGSPAAKAGLQTGDFVRMIDGKPTRDMSGVTGTRLLRGAPGSKVSLLVIRGNAADPHEVRRSRATRSTGDVGHEHEAAGRRRRMSASRASTRDAPAALKQIRGDSRKRRSRRAP